MTPHELNVAAHVGAGAAALAVGLVPLAARKGEALHRFGGRGFVAFGGVVLVTALIAVIFYDPPPALTAAVLTAGYQYVGSLRALVRKARGPGAFDALFAVAALATSAVLLRWMTSGTLSWPPALGYATLGALSAVAVYDLSRPLWRERWVRGGWPLDHGLKMTGAYFAMASAGVGNVFQAWQPWSQFGPTIVGVLVSLWLTAAWLARAGRSRPIPA